jgi:hypothetical protein
MVANNTPTTFSDEELAYLKAELPYNESILFQCARKAFRLDALLLRLELAEDAVNQAYRCDSRNLEYYKKWKTATGKANVS